MDISIILNCHSEGILVHRTIRALERMRAFASAKGITTEVIAVLDKATLPTKEYFIKHKTDFQLFETTFGDLGSARNFGVEKASGKYIAFQDADDLFSRNWLAEAFSFSEKQPEDVVLHTEYAVTFDTPHKDIWKRFSHDSPHYQPHTYVKYNPYDALCFTSKKILEQVKYPVAMAGSGFGYEDWHWNSTIEARGIKHFVVPETVLFIRRKKHGSLLQSHNTFQAIIPYSELFEPAKFMSVVEFEKSEYKDSRVNIFQPASFTEIPKKNILKVLIRKSVKLVFRVFKFFFEKIFSDRKNKINSKGLTTFIKYAKLQKRAIKMLLSSPSEEDIESFVIQPVEKKQDLSVPMWLIAEWKQLNQIDPAIVFSYETLAWCNRYAVPEYAELGMCYYEFCKQYEGEYDHVFIVPWLKMGGADLVTIHFINGLIKNGHARRIMLITTEDNSEWLHTLHYSVKVVLFNKKFNYLPHDEKQALLAKVLIQFKVKNTHIINSLLGYQTLEKFGNAISKMTDIYVHVFCEEYDAEDNLVGYAFEQLNAVYPFTKKILTDNQRFINFLVDMYGYDPERFKCVYQPVDAIAESVKVSSPGSKLRIIWSGRFDKQKRPDILIRIAKELANDPMIEIDVYGKTVLDGEFKLNELEELPNVNYKGVYSSWKNLKTDDYDVFLYTSGYDGVPNVVLEALSSGMILIVPNQGGLAEVVKNNINGFVIDSNENVEAYVQRILEIKNNRALKASFFDHTKQLLKRYHSQENFDAALEMFKDESIRIFPPASIEGPLVSVVLPVYNGQKYLREAVESILNQTYRNFEIIIMNDGSTDSTQDIINSFTDSRIKVIIRNENKGLIYNLNDGLSIANGKYIARMDADDIALPDRLAKQVDFLESNPEIGICGTWFRLFEEDGNSFTIMHPSNHDDIVMTLLFRYCSLGHPTVMFRKNAIGNKLYSEEYLGAEDYKLWSELVKTTRMANLPEVLLYYRWHTDNISNTKKEKQLELDARIKREGIEDWVIGRPLTPDEDYLLSELMFKSEKNLVNKSLYDRIERFKNELIKTNKSNGTFNPAIYEKYLNLIFSTHVIKIEDPS